MKIEKSAIFKLLVFCFILFANEAIAFSEQNKNKSNFTKLKGMYLGQIPPANDPALFAPGIVSTKHFEHSSPTLSPDGNEMYWSVHYPRELKSNRPIMYMKRINNVWTKPEEALFSSIYYNGNPFFSPDGKKLYFGSNRPLNKNEKLKKSRIWFVEKSGSDWSKPLSLNSVINSTGQEAQPVISKSGTLFFLSHYKDAIPPYGIYYSKLIDGKYLKKQILKKSFNTKHPDWTPFIAPDESYFIFCSFRPGGFGSGDLYISFKQKDGSWGQIKNMGNKINTGRNERFPIISPDGKYLFFNSTKRIPGANENSPGNGKGDIYWVSSSIINYLKTENLNIVDILTDTVKQNGVDSVPAKFEELKKRHKKYFIFDESILFLTAMKFVRSKKPLVALEILKKNSKLFPEKYFVSQQLLISIIENDPVLSEQNLKLISKKITKNKILKDELNNLGYQLYKMKEYKKAVKVFGYIVKLFPESSNSYNNYAEILTVIGDIEAAIINYKIVLKLDPKNIKIKKQLESLQKILQEKLKQSNSKIFKYTIKWEKKTNIPEARRNLKIAAVGNKIYALGGYGQPHKGVEKGNFCYDIKNDKWTIKKDMVIGRSNFAIVSAYGKIYTIGGDKFLDKCEVYNPETDKWKKLSPLLTARQHINAAIIKNKIYVPGGRINWLKNLDKAIVKSFEVYDIKNDFWKTITPFPQKIENPSLAVAKGRLYVINSSDRSMRVYIPESQSWEEKKKIPSAFFIAGSTVIDNKIFVLDGVRPNEKFSRLFVYDPVDDTWSNATHLPAIVKLSGFTSVKDKLYVIGGCDHKFIANNYIFVGEIKNEDS